MDSSPLSDAQILYLFAALFGSNADHAMAVIAAEHRRRPAQQAFIARLPPEGFKLKMLERAVIVATLRQAEWNQDEAAKRLGISARVLNYKMRVLGLPRRFRDQPKPIVDADGRTKQERETSRAKYRRPWLPRPNEVKRARRA